MRSTLPGTSEPSPSSILDAGFNEPTYAVDLACPFGDHPAILAHLGRTRTSFMEGGTEVSFWLMQSINRTVGFRLLAYVPVEEIAARQKKAFSASLDDLIQGLRDGPRTSPGSEPHWEWIDYEASPFDFGARRLADDRSYTRLFSRAQVAITDLLIDLSTEADGVAWGGESALLTHFLRLLIASLDRLALGAEPNARYLEYHRDHLARHLYLGSPTLTNTPEVILGNLQNQIDGRQQVSDWVNRLLESPAPTNGDQLTKCWLDRLEEFFSYVEGFRDRDLYNLDPHASDSTHLPLFKLLHGASNQHGLRVGNELYAYQLVYSQLERCV